MDMTGRLLKSDILEGSATTQRVKTYFYYHNFKRGKSQKWSVRVCGHRAPTLFLGSYGLVSSLFVSRHKLAETNELPTKRWALHAEETRVPSRKQLLMSSKAKNCLLQIVLFFFIILNF